MGKGVHGRRCLVGGLAMVRPMDVERLVLVERWRVVGRSDTLQLHGSLKDNLPCHPVWDSHAVHRNCECDQLSLWEGPPWVFQISLTVGASDEPY